MNISTRNLKRHQNSNRCKRNFEIVETNTKEFKKFCSTQIDYKIKIKADVKIEPAIERMLTIANEKGHYKPGDALIVAARHPQFRQKKVSGVIDRKRPNVQNLIEQIGKIVTSNEEINLTNIEWNVKVIHMNDLKQAFLNKS